VKKREAIIRMNGLLLGSKKSPARRESSAPGSFCAGKQRGKREREKWDHFS
jgi:hypothetical protein